MISSTTMLSSELSIDSFMKYKNCNLDMLDELTQFYETFKDKEVQPKQNNNFTRNADNDDEWKRHEARNWLTEVKRNRDDDEKLYAQIRSILNKLSDENFAPLVADIKKLTIVDEEHLAKLAEFIFNKALDEPKFCVRYAKLAYDFARYENYNNGVMCFRKLIITRCQATFTELPKASKEKAKGCMSFIGELYNCDLLPNTIIFFCFNELITMHEKKIGEYFIECIFVFMKTIGEKFWKNSNANARLIFGKLNELINSGNLSNREKFSLMDTTDLMKKYVTL